MKTKHLTMDLSGLSGDTKTLFEDIEKRMSVMSDTDDKVVIAEEVRSAMGELKDLDARQIKELLGDSDKGLRSIIKVLGEKVTSMTEGAKNKPENMSVRSQVAKWVEDNKQAIADLRQDAGGNRRRADLPGLQIRAAITMTEGTSLGGSVYLPNAQVLPGVIDLVRVQPTFWDRLAKPSTKANPLVWVNKTNKQGNAAFIGEGVLKPLASFELSTESSTPKKVAERMKISTEMLNDIDYITGVIENELRYEVDMASSAAVLTGTASATNPKGVTKYASAYTLATITGITAPNNSDAIIAAIAQLRSLNFNGTLTAYMNPVDIAIMNLAKSTQGVYVIPPFSTANGMQIGGVTIVEDNNIAVGYLLIGDMSKYHVQMYQDFFVAWGWENDDFTKNLITVIGERRFHQWVSANETGAFIYDTFANIKTII